MFTNLKLPLILMGLVGMGASSILSYGQAPTPQPQPNVQFYSTTALTNFKTYTRDEYRAAFGKPAPVCESNKAVKVWFDSTVDLSEPDALVLYKQIGKAADGSPALRQYAMPASEAASVNMPGVEKYPDYAPAPTSAMRGGGTLNPVYLSMESDARALMATLGGNSLTTEELPGYPVSYGLEPRRLWTFVVNGQSYNVGSLIASRNAQGVGAPGRWGTVNGFVSWIPDPPADDCSKDTSVRTPPVRDLLANERFNISGLGAVGIERTDLRQVANQTVDNFTTDDRATLQEIVKWVRAQAVSK